MSVHDANYKKIKKELGIPEAEPIFVLRAQDDLAAHILTRYRNVASSIENDAKRPSTDWFAELDSVISAFMAWRNEYGTKVPD